MTSMGAAGQGHVGMRTEKDLCYIETIKCSACAAASKLQRDHARTSWASSRPATKVLDRCRKMVHH